MNLGEIPKLAISLNGVMSATDAGTAMEQVSLGVKAIEEMAAKIANIKQYAQQAGQYFEQISEKAASLFAKASEVSAIGDNFLKQAGEVLTHNGEVTGAEIGDVVSDDNSTNNNIGAIPSEGGSGNTNLGDNGGSFPIGAGSNSGVSPAPVTNGSVGAESTPSPRAFGYYTVPNEPDSEEAGAYFDRRREQLDEEQQVENERKAEIGDPEAQEKINELTGVISEQPKKNVNNGGLPNKNPEKDDIDRKIAELRDENKGEKDKKEKFKPLVEEDAANFAQIKKQIKSLDDTMNKNKEGFANVKKDAKEKMKKGEAKCVEQGALSTAAIASATKAQGLNQTAADLFMTNNPLTVSAALGFAATAFATNQTASAIDQQANKAGQDASKNYQTAINDMNNGLSKFVLPQNGLANQKMTLAQNLLTLNNARKEQIQSVQEGEQNIARNNAQIQHLQNQRPFGLQTVVPNSSNIA